MAQENVEKLEAVYERWAGGDFWTPDVFAPDIEVVWAGEVPDIPPGGRGLSAIEGGMRTFLAAWDEYGWEAERFIPAEDDRVLVLFTARGRGKGSNLEVEAHWAHLWTFRQGEATHLEGFTNPAQAFEAAGLRA